MIYTYEKFLDIIYNTKFNNMDDKKYDRKMKRLNKDKDRIYEMEYND